MKYQVTGWQDVTHYGFVEIEAPTAAEAIEAARQKFIDADVDLEDATSEAAPVHCFEAELTDRDRDVDRESADYAKWESPDNIDRAGMFAAARAMLAALEAVYNKSHPRARYVGGPAVEYVVDKDVVDGLRTAIAQAKAAGIATEGE